MKSLKHFSIPIKGLKNGIHQFEFLIDGNFFQQFEASPIENANFKANVMLEKSLDNMLFEFDFDGSVHTECDRCLAPILLPIEDKQRIIVKVGEGESDDPEVVFIHEDAHEFNVAPFLYEFINLAMPFNKVYDCEKDTPPPCNFEILKRIQREEDIEQSLDEDDNPSDDDQNPVWDALKDFKGN